MSEKIDPQSYYLSGIKLYLCVVSIIFCMLLTMIDQMIATTAIKGLEHSFHEFSKIGWTTSAYMLPNAVLSLLWGRFGMLFGRRYCLLVSVFLFELGSLVSAVTPTMNGFICGRAITGIGAAGIQTGGMIVISEVSPVSKRGFLMGLMMLTMAPSGVLGPLVGGAFTNSKSLTWRWCFYINLPFGGVAALCLLLFYRPPRVENLLSHIPKTFPDNVLKLSKAIDLFGVSLLSGSWILLLVGISLNSWKSPSTLSLVIIGGLLAIVGVVYDIWIYKPDENNIPLIYKNWIALRGVISPSLVLFFGSITMFGSLTYLTVYFEIILNRPALDSGIDVLPVMIAAIPTALVSGILASKKKIMKPFLIASGPLLSIGCGLITTLNENTSAGKHIGYLIFIGIGFALTMQPAILSAQFTTIPDDAIIRKLVVTSFLTYSKNLGSAIGGVVATSIYTSVDKTDLRSLHAVFWACLGSSLLTFLVSLFANRDPSRESNESSV